MWRAVRQLYMEDRVVEALDAADNLGGFDSNDLYAEAEVRRDGVQAQLRPWLTLEAIESQIPHHIEQVHEAISSECDSLSERFHWDHSTSTLVSLLPTDVEAPWMPGRWGYYVDKVPYGKICLPHHLVGHPEELRRTIQHEFMHDITQNLSHGRVTRWLSEALSTYAENRLDQRAWSAFQDGSAEWLAPAALEGIVTTDNRQPELQRKISEGYAQANLLARYLVIEGGEAKIGDLLSAIGNPSVLAALRDEVLSRSHVDHALQKVYGYSEPELFARAHEWVLATAVPSA